MLDPIDPRSGLFCRGLVAALVASGGCGNTSGTDASQGSWDASAESSVASDPVEAGVVDAPMLDSGLESYTLFMVNVSSGFEIGALAVDDTHVYWAQRGRLLRRALDGTGTEENIAVWWGTLLGGEVAVDQDYVYWLDFEQWLRGPKTGGTSEVLPLEATGGDVAADAQYAYAALIDCASVARVPHGGSTSEIIYPAEPVTRSTGLTYLTLDGNDIYCAGGHYVFVSHNWGPLEKLTSDGVELEGVAVVNGEVYWLDQTATGSKANLFHRSSDGQIKCLGTVDAQPRGRPIADSERRRILFANGGIISWSTDTGEYKILMNQSGWSSYQVTRDKNFFYWGSYTTDDASIKRMPIGQE
jgi:hypothetical protein